MTASFHRIFGIIATAIVLTAFVWGLFITGSPITGRKRQFDERRVGDLRAISNEITNIVYDKARNEPNAKPSRPVPKTLDEVLTLAQYQRPEIADPETGEPYVYKVLSQTRYQLCAAFAFERRQQYDIFWDHPAGQHCFSFDVTQQDGLGKPMEKPMPVPRSPAPVE